MWMDAETKFAADIREKLKSWGHPNPDLGPIVVEHPVDPTACVMRPLLRNSNHLPVPGQLDNDDSCDTPIVIEGK